MEAQPTRLFTPQQQTAIETRDVSIVLSSGAGCGKTHVLTHRYLSHLKSDRASISQIVAITFTDRAAREMRDRIRRAIADEQRRADDGTWEQHLRDLETATVATIHSFCGNLLRQFAVPAGLDPQFEVMSPVLADNLQNEALRDTLEELLTDSSPAGNDLRELVVLYGWAAVVNTVRELMHERDPVGWQQWLSRSPADIAHDWQEVQRPALLPLWLEYLMAAGGPITHLVNLFETVPCSGPLMRANVAKVLEGLPRLAQATDLASAIEELCEAAKVGKERAKAWPDDATYELVQEAMAKFRKALPEQFALFSEDPGDVVAAATVGQRFLRVAFAVTEAFQQRKTALGALDFQDLLVLARDLLHTNDDVRTSLQARYRFLLLDEMQDTDPVQMEFIKLLCGDHMATGKLFAVGDRKQSIYRFRGADVALFEALQADVPDAGRLNLTRNFRSQPNILSFVNALCCRRMAHYEPLEPNREAAHERACVEFLWSVPYHDEGTDDATALRTREADMIARRIRAILDDPLPWVNDPVTKELRRAQLGDIVLLFRSMSNVAIYESALRQHDLNYYLVGGRAFYAQQEIYDLLNLLRTLENPDDSISLAGVLRSPFGCLSDDTLVILGMHRDGLWAGLHDDDRLQSLPEASRVQVVRVRQWLNTWRANKDRLTIAQLLSKAIADTAYDAALQFEFLGDRKLANLWKLIELARAFDRSGQFGLPEFVARLDDLISSQPREEQAATQPENADVIKIMSIHQAKGLEYPIVIVPDFAASTRGGSRSFARWDRALGCLPRPPAEDPPLLTEFPHRLGLACEEVAEWREDLRILYVACTRPRDVLILSASFKEPLPSNTPANLPVPIKTTNAWLAALNERFNIRTGECIAIDVPATARPNVRVRLVSPVVSDTDARQRSTPPALPRFPSEQFQPLPTSPFPAIVPAAKAFGHPELTPLRVLLQDWDADNMFTQHEQLDLLQQSPWPKRWQDAKQSYRSLEYVAPISDDPTWPLIRGSIDWLWEESDGWHLLMIDAGEQRTTIELQFQADAIRIHLGERVQSATLFNLTNGTSTTLDANDLGNVNDLVRQQLNGGNE